MTTQQVQRVLNKLGSFQQAKDRYTSDRNLSAEGKTRALQNVEAERKAYRAEAVRALAEAWSDVRLKWDLIQLKQDIEEQKQAQAWDYTALTYLSNSVRDRVKNSLDTEDVAKWYVPLLQSGDKHTARAAAEAGAQAIRQRFGVHNIKAQELSRQGDQKLKELTDSPVYHEAYNDMQKLVKEAIDLQQTHDYIKSQYSAGGMWDTSTDFQKAQEGISLTLGYDTDKHMQYTTLNVEDQAAAEGQAAAASA